MVKTNTGRAKISIRMIVRDVLDVLPQALHDDPNAFREPDTLTRYELFDELDKAGRDMLTSTVRGQIGKHLDFFTQSIDAEWYAENSWGDYEQITNDMLADPIDAGPAAETICKVWGGLGRDWDAKLDTAKNILRMVADDLIKTGSAAFVVNDDLVDRYLKLRPDLAEMLDKPAATAATAEQNWDDDDDEMDSFAVAEQPVAEPPVVEPPVIASAPVLDALVSVGFDAKEIASLLCVSGSFVSMVRTGKRPFPALKADQREAFLGALEKRAIAIEALMRNIEGGKV